MTEPKPEQLEELMKFLLETAKESKDLIKDQAPQIFQDIVNYGVYVHGGGLLAFVTLVLIGVYNILKARKISTIIKHDEDPMIPELCLRLFGGITVTVIGFIGIMIQGHDFLTALFAPRVFIIQFLS